jgi:hypothetical protein
MFVIYRKKSNQVKQAPVDWIAFGDMYWRGNVRFGSIISNIYGGGGMEEVARLCEIDKS